MILKSSLKQTRNPRENATARCFNSNPPGMAQSTTDAEKRERIFHGLEKAMRRKWSETSHLPNEKNIILLVFLFLVAQGQKARFLLSISKHTPARTYMYT